MNIVDYLEKRKTLRNIKRFNMEKVLHSQNLCEHGFNVANLYMLICDMLGFQYTKKEVFLVMNHDFAECYTGDLNLAIKSKAPELWEEFEEKLVPSHIPTDKNIEAYFSQNSTQEKYELFLFVDALEAYLYCLDEVTMGNKFMKKARDIYFDKLSKMNPNLFFSVLNTLKSQEEE